MIKFHKIKHNVLKLLPQLVDSFKNEEGIICIYLFGSYAKGKVTPLSDVDIAILFDERIPMNEYFTREMDLLGKAIKILRTDEISFVLLNKIPLFLKYKIIKEGKLIYCNNDNKRILFQSQVTDHFLDFQPFHEEYRKFFFQAIRQKGLQ